MKREELIKQCRYYKGEKENPYTETKGVIWGYEKKYVDMCAGNETHILVGYMLRYESDGLKSYKSTDNIPMSLKALLYCRYSDWNMSGPDGFKNFYEKYYSK